MKATYDALCKYGYANLTIQKISDEFEKSKSLMYYHYDSKDDLLVEFLQFALEQFTTDLMVNKTNDPETRLRDLINRLLPRTIDDDDHKQLGVAIFELRSKASFDESYYNKITEIDDFLREQIAELVEIGIEEGVFREVDPDEVANMVVAIINGTMVERVTAETNINAIRSGLFDYLNNYLFVHNTVQ